ncbi:MAG: phospholipid carrier-dependent glycosyltransferase [Candidatus Limnocylindria bacterium]
MGAGAAFSRRRSPAIDHPRAWSRLDWTALAAVALGGAALRLVGLSRPVGLVFDEIFYAQNACQYVLGSAECGIGELAGRSHPPLGNWLIGIGIRIFGYNEFGWRITAALAGALTIGLLYLLVRRLLAGRVSEGAATVGSFSAAGLLAIDFLHLVQSRMAMLDVFVTLFVVAAVLFAVLDVTRDRGSATRSWWTRLALGRPWRLLTGASLGAAVGVKWSGAYAGLVVVALLVAWETAASRDGHEDDGVRRSWWGAFAAAARRESPRSLVLLGLVPLVIYLASYIGRIPGAGLGLPWVDGTFLQEVWQHQERMLRFHVGLGGNHPYESPAWSWLLDKRPVTYYFRVDDGAYRHILALGNPLAWWAGGLAVIGLGVAWVRDGMRLARPEPVLLGAVAATYLPWLLLTASRSFVFIWYLLPTVPFLCAALGVVAAHAWRGVPGRVAVGVAGAVLIASFAFFFPVLTALRVSPDDWRTRIWFADCARPAAPTLELPDDVIDNGPPPAGWCWI